MAKKTDKQNQKTTDKEKKEPYVAAKGDYVKVHYTGTFDDGTMFDSSEKHGHPLDFEAGAGHVIKGFDDAVIGMKEGEEKSIKILPAEAYGEHNDQMVRTIPKSALGNAPEMKEGMTLMLSTPGGMQMPVKVLTVANDNVTLDFNHPLAGKTLNFKLKMVGKGEKPTGCDCGHEHSECGGGCC